MKEIDCYITFCMTDEISSGSIGHLDITNPSLGIIGYVPVFANQEKAQKFNPGASIVHFTVEDIE